MNSEIKGCLFYLTHRELLIIKDTETGKGARRENRLLLKCVDTVKSEG